MENSIREIGKEIITIAEDVWMSERMRLQMLLSKTQKMLIYTIVFLSVMGFIIGQVLSKVVVKPLKSLEERMNQITEGKLRTVSINSSDREIVSLTNAFNKMLKELELRQRHLVQREKLASLGTLLSGVAHELNNPLSNISSSCQILTEEIEVRTWNSKKNFFHRLMSRQTGPKISSVRSWIFPRDKEFKREVLSLKKLLDETIQFIKGEVPSRISVKLDVPDDLTIFADKQRIQQAFLNLVKNAVESIDGEGSVSITACKHLLHGTVDERCDYQKDSGQCTGECPMKTDTIDIEIKDTGSGIPPEVLPKIFDPFFSTEILGKVQASAFLSFRKSFMSMGDVSEFAVRWGKERPFL